MAQEGAADTPGRTPARRYPQLAPDLRALPGHALRLWGDPTARQRALAAVLTAWETGSGQLDAAIRRVDRAVVSGLAAVGLPRGPIAGIAIDELGLGAAGTKRPDCTIRFAATHLRHALVRDRQPDRAFSTWIHESLHARQPYAPAAAHEYASHAGYEEGMVKGLERHIVGVLAGMSLGPNPYDYYLAAYQTLADTFELDLERLWRALWKYPAGEVRAGFVVTVASLNHARSGVVLTTARQSRLRGVADQLFGATRQNYVPDATLLARLWRTV